MTLERLNLFNTYSEQYGVDVEIVELIADQLGEDEDYDGLPAMLSELFLRIV